MREEFTIEEIRALWDWLGFEETPYYQTALDLLSQSDTRVLRECFCEGFRKGFKYGIGGLDEQKEKAPDG